MFPMDDEHRREHIAGHIATIYARAQPDTDRLVAAMIGRCWPRDTGDRTEPGALDWVRRWGPRCTVPLPPVCSCALGCCSICN